MSLDKPKTETSKQDRRKPDSETAYRVEGRTFIVQPVFQEDGQTTLASLLMNLMRADAFAE